MVELLGKVWSCDSGWSFISACMIALLLLQDGCDLVCRSRPTHVVKYVSRVKFSNTTWYTTWCACCHIVWCDVNTPTRPWCACCHIVWCDVNTPTRPWCVCCHIVWCDVNTPTRPGLQCPGLPIWRDSVSINMYHYMSNYNLSSA